jgi:hypothetical protein
MVWVVAAIVVWASYAGLGARIASQKDREPIEGLLLGLLCGPIGALVEALLPQGSSRRGSHPKASGPEEDLLPDPDLLMFGPPEPSQRGWRLPQGAFAPPPEDDPPPVVEKLDF